ncbi:hypothetical protein J8L98_02180 [Pseudoalteromonas sp. MMG013]|uniref:hypothetical protein n=1 Tax=Pseudoalteromonas sp. MMG013 TaxID=2822687 RepID=UPI001B397FC6|nr:hypothetical protein [Pseudoalteromonas sp. MMG013]MBQ4860500.1 hypothetical protein [Pseudoalteromonas sp. MMG013]
MSEILITLFALIGAGFGLGIGAYFGVTVVSVIGTLIEFISYKINNSIIKLRGKHNANS